MPSCVTSTFGEPEDFEVALRQEGCLGLLIAGHGKFQACLSQVILHEQRLSAAQEQLARIAFIAVPADMVLIAFTLIDGTVPVWGGIRLPPGEIVTLGPGESLHVRSDGPHRWGAVWLPDRTLARYGAVLTGAPLLFRAKNSWRPRPGDSRHLNHLHAAAMRMAKIRPRALIDNEAARGLEQQIIHAIVKCLMAGSTDADHRSTRRHRDIMVRFEDLLRKQPDRAFLVPEITEALGVSERLLRSLCAAHLGMSPASYGRLRRISQVRSILREDTTAISVSNVARRNGFRDLGRFAANYRIVFGESPSATSRRRR